MLRFLVVLLAGKLIVSLLMGLPASKRLPKWQYGFWRELYSCDLCLGVWVYFTLVAFYRIEFISAMTGWYVPLVNEALSAAAISFTVHLFSLGWKLKYGTFEVR